MKVFIKFPDREGYYAELVDIIRQNEKLTHEQWWKYYAADSKVKLTAVENTRLVFKRESGGYTIIPDIPKNRNFWHIQ